MKVIKLTLVLAALFLFGMPETIVAQRGNTATVVAHTDDISDNLDLQAVASVFGDSNDLEDFERRLNDPSMQLSNLDLNNDGYVDYLRVIEVAEKNKRVIVIQSILGQDQYQDVATIELEKTTSRSNNVTIQIVGNPYLYGPNYIYEPFYYRRPIFFDYFWLATYRPYYSPWYWGYYPTYFSYWAPMPIYTYHTHIHTYINTNNRYVYTDNRRMSGASRVYAGVSRNAYETTNPRNGFTSRNQNMTNRYALENSRGMVRNQNGILTTRDNSSVISRDNGRAINNSSNSRVSNTTISRNGNARNIGTPVRSDFKVGTTRINEGQRTNVSTNSRITNISRNSVRIDGVGASRNTSFNSNTSNSQRIQRSETINSGRNYNSSTSNRSYNSSISTNRGSYSTPSSGSFSRSSGSISTGSRGFSGGGFSGGGFSGGSRGVSGGGRSAGR